MKEWAPLEVEIYKRTYQAASAGNYDIYVVFVEKGLSLLNAHGQLGFILPSKFFSTDYGSGLRKLITSKQYLSAIVDFGHAQVFDGATTYTCLLFLTKGGSQFVSVAKVKEPSSIASVSPVFNNVSSSTLTEQPWVFNSEIERVLAEKIGKDAVPLIELPSDIARGTSSGADDIFILIRGQEGIVTRQGEVVDIEQGILRKPIYATDFGRYEFKAPNDELIIFPYGVDKEGYQLMSEETLRKTYPKAYRYLQKHKKELEARKQYKSWYGYSAPRSLNVHDNAQMLIPLLADRGLLCRLPTDVSHYCLMASGGFSITVQPSCELNPNYVLGLLNSRLLFWRLHSISNVFRGGWITCTKQYVETLPIRPIDFNDPADAERHARMVRLVEQMLELHRRRQAAPSDHERELYQRQIDAADRRIDALVYELYALTPEEIALVEQT
jgi:hypothetical protein